MTEIEIEKENAAIAAEYRNLLKISYQTLTEDDKKLIRLAFNTAVDAHKEQRRKSGEAYIFHPIAVAKKVMEDTPHVILAGVGAEEFAVSQGFKRENLLTEQSKKDWEIWKKTSKYEPIINIENHDTIGMLAIDKNGTISGGCTTSGLAYKMPGRVGDSAVVGSGLFVDNQIGAATATGLGEEVLKTVGSYLIVELMRQGKSPQEACEQAILRIIEKTPNFEDFQVGYIAVNKKGETGAYSIHEGFTATTYQDQKNTTFNPNFYNKK